MKKLSIERIGKRGSIVMLIAGILCLAFGIFLQIRTNDLPFDAVELTATITAFEDSDQSKMQTTTTLVSYTFEGHEYKNIPLGQYEGSWRVGDSIRICLHSEEPAKIWTRTMQYRGIFYILFSASFLLVAIYKLLQFRKEKFQPESDIDDSVEDAAVYTVSYELNGKMESLTLKEGSDLPAAPGRLFHPAPEPCAGEVRDVG